MSVAQLTGVLTANNVTFPSGQLSDDGTKIPVSTIGQLTSEEAIEDLVVGFSTPAIAPPVPVDPNASPAPAASAPAAPAAPTPITIGDLGTVELVDVATTGFARTNGKPSLSLSVTKTSDANTVLVAEDVQASWTRSPRAIPTRSSSRRCRTCPTSSRNRPTA